MKKDVLVIGAAILDILARPTSESVFESGSYACDDIKISFGGDALNDAILLSKMGKSVELISVIGNDKEGHMIASECNKHSIELRNPLRDDIQTGVNIVLVKEDGSRHFLTNKNGSLRKLCLDDIIFIVNNNYYDPNINYNDHTLSYMKSNYYIHYLLIFDLNYMYLIIIGFHYQITY